MGPDFGKDWTMSTVFTNRASITSALLIVAASCNVLLNVDGRCATIRAAYELKEDEG